MKLKEQHQALIELEVLASDLGIDINNPMIKNTKIYKLLQNVTELNASELNISEKALILLGKIVATLTSIHTVDLSKNQKDGLDIDFPKIVAEFIKSPKITTFNISNNLLGCDGSKVVLELTTSKILKNLDISNNFIYMNWLNIITNLSSIKSLKSLNISNNGLGSEYIDRIADKFVEFTSLEILNISNNSLDRYFIPTLIKGIIKAPDIKDVNLKCSHLSEGPADFVKKIFEDHNTKVKESFKDKLLIFIANHIDEKTYNADVDLPLEILGEIFKFNENLLIDFTI